jgi:GNAT superfamily N-acetyltransferase
MGPPPFHVEEIHRDRAALIEAAMGAEGELVVLRFARGCRCFAVLLEGAIAGYGWLSTGPEWIGEIQLEIRPRKAEGYIWNCVTLPEHRRKGIFRSVVIGAANGARETGVRRVWIGSVDIPAEKALAPIGFEPAARFRTRRFGSLYLAAARYADSVVGGDARRVLPVRARFYGGTVTSRRH